MVLGARREREHRSSPIAGPFRQVSDKIETVDGIPRGEALQAVLGLLTECGIRLYERESSGDRELFLVAPADALIPVSRVLDLLRLARPRLRWPKHLPAKIGRLARLRPPSDKAAPDTPPASHPNRVKK